MRREPNALDVCSEAAPIKISIFGGLIRGLTTCCPTVLGLGPLSFKGSKPGPDDGTTIIFFLTRAYLYPP